MSVKTVTEPKTDPNASPSAKKMRKRRVASSAEGAAAAAEAGELDDEDDLVAPPVGDGDDDDAADLGDADFDPLANIDFEKEKPAAKTEAAHEIEAAKLMNEDAGRAFTAAREKSILEQRARGSGGVNYSKADAAGNAAAERVRRRHMLGREPGFYVTSPFVATDVNDRRVEFPVNARVPLEVIVKLGKKQVRALIDGGELEDLRD